MDSHKTKMIKEMCSGLPVIKEDIAHINNVNNIKEVEIMYDFWNEHKNDNLASQIKIKIYIYKILYKDQYKK